MRICKTPEQFARRHLVEVTDNDHEIYQSIESESWSEFFDHVGIDWRFTKWRARTNMPEYYLPQHGLFHVVTAWNYPDDASHFQDLSDRHGVCVNVVFDYPYSESDAYVYAYFPKSWPDDVIAELHRKALFSKCSICDKHLGMIGESETSMKSGGCCKGGRYEPYRDEFDIAGYNPSAEYTLKMLYMENRI